MLWPGDVPAVWNQFHLLESRMRGERREYAQAINAGRIRINMHILNLNTHLQAICNTAHCSQCSSSHGQDQTQRSCSTTHTPAGSGMYESLKYCDETTTRNTTLIGHGARWNKTSQSICHTHRTPQRSTGFNRLRHWQAAKQKYAFELCIRCLKMQLTMSSVFHWFH